MNEVLKPRLYVVANDVLSTKDKACLQLFDIETERRLIFERKRSMMAVGAVYEIETSLDGDRLAIHRPRFVGRSDDPRVEEWQAAQQAFKLIQREASIEAKMATDTFSLDNSVKKLRMARDRLTPAQKLPFDLWLLNELRKA